MSPAKAARYGAKGLLGGLLFCLVLGAALVPTQSQAQSQTQSQDRADVRATPLPEPPVLPEAFTWVGGLALSSDDTRIGGISGLDVGLVPSPIKDALRFLDVTDSGNLLTGDLSFRYEDGLKLDGLVDNQLLIDRLIDAKTGAWARQAESLATWDQRLAIGFEVQHRVGVMRTKTRITDLPVPTALRQLSPKKAGIEALATLPDGSLFAVSEGLQREGGLRAWVYQGQADDWPVLVYEWDGDFAPTGADASPDGRFVVVSERKFVSMREPLSNRLMILNVEDIREGARLVPQKILDLDAVLGAVANVEAVALVPTASADEFLVFVATDNNFISLLPSMIAILRWRPS